MAEMLLNVGVGADIALSKASILAVCVGRDYVCVKRKNNKQIYQIILQKVAEDLRVIAQKWLDNYLPPIPLPIRQVPVVTGTLGASQRLLRWARFQLAAASKLTAETDQQPVLLHWHFGFGSSTFQQQLLETLKLLLEIEAAQYSLKSWSPLQDWLDSSPSPIRLRLFNLACWAVPTQPTHWLALPAKRGEITILAGEQPITTLSTAHPALYEPEAGPLVTPSEAATRMRPYYLPAAGANHPDLPAAIMSGRSLPVAAWLSAQHGVELSEERLRAAQSASSSPVLWRVGSGTGKRALLSRSSILFFWGRVPGAGAFERSACPNARLVLSITCRSRALRWGEVPGSWHTMQVGPALAEWFGLPSARLLNYRAADFYPALDGRPEQQLRQLIERYLTLQNKVNQRLTESGETELLTSLPWNLLHWIRDAESAQAVFQHKVGELARAGNEQAALVELLRNITVSLAELQPVWQQLAALPVTELAYVIVPIHIARPQYLTGWLPLTRDLRSRPLPELAHLTFISLSELKRTAAHPTWPIYLTTVEPRYWWALRQLPASTDLRSLWYRPLLHDSYCHALSQQHQLESEALYRQLLPLTALAPVPQQAAKELAADIQATIETLNLRSYLAPIRFHRSDATTWQTEQHSLNRTSLNWPSRKQQLVTELESDAPAMAIEAIGRIPENPAWWELDEEQLLGNLSTGTIDFDDLLHQAKQAEEEADVAEAESAELVPNRGRRIDTAQSQTNKARPRRLVWRRDLLNSELFQVCQAGELRQGDYYFDETELRRHLKRTVARTAQALPDSDLPFWKQALRDYVKVSCGGRPSDLYRKMTSGTFAGVKLNLSERHFVRVYLAWDEYKQPIPSDTRLPGSYRNRAAVAQVVGKGAQDEMQLLGWEVATGRSLSTIEREQFRQALQGARQALLTWWMHRPGRLEQTELSLDQTAQDISNYVARHPHPFLPAFGRSGSEMGKQVGEYFLSMLLESVQIYRV